MKIMFRTACFIAVLSLYTCSSTKQTTATNATEAKAEVQTTNAKEMIEKGFSKGTITASKSEGCPYVLTVEQFKDKLDPVNMDQFYKEGKIPSKVWVKFASLRMSNRCSDARPVSISAIEKRVE